jgi:hypothetical protein
MRIYEASRRNPVVAALRGRGAWVVAMKDPDSMTLDEIQIANAREILQAERRIRALRIEEQEALAVKAKTELRTQQIIHDLTEEHRRTIRLPELKLS